MLIIEYLHLRKATEKGSQEEDKIKKSFCLCFVFQKEQIMHQNCKNRELKQERPQYSKKKERII